jgi:hypothetical protein
MESTAIGENSNFAEYSPLFILFLPYLAKLSQYLRLYSLEWKGDKWWLIGKDVEESGRGQILRYYPGIFLEGLRKTTNISLSG